MVGSLRVAAFQRQPRFGDVPGTTDRLLADLAWCDGNGVDLFAPNPTA